MGLPRRYDPGGNPLNILSASMPAAATALEAARDETTARNELPGHVVEVNAVPMVTAVPLTEPIQGLLTVAAVPEVLMDETTARKESPGHGFEVNAVPMVTAVLLWPSRLNEGLSTVAAE